MTQQTLPGAEFFFETSKATALDAQQVIERLTADLTRAGNDGTVNFIGPCVFLFRVRTPDLQKPFTLEIGFPVAPGTRPFGPFHVRRLEPFRCAAVTLRGPGSLIDKAYDKLDPAVDAAGLHRTEEAREVYLNWEGADSANDQILVAIGVK